MSHNLITKQVFLINCCSICVAEHPEEKNSPKIYDEKKIAFLLKQCIGTNLKISSPTLQCHIKVISPRYKSQCLT